MTVKGKILSIAFLLLLLVAIFAGKFYYENLRGAKYAVLPPSDDITKAENLTGLPLFLPAGFKIELFAKNLLGARVMEFDDQGNMWVSRTSEGVVSLLYLKDGKVSERTDVFRSLRKPHGLLSWDGKLFIAEEHRVSSIATYSDDTLHKLVDLPSGDGHFTRTIDRGPDDKIYVSIGSSCNVCNEKDERRAKIFTMNRDGSDFKEFARGLRNTVFFAWDYVNGKMWGTENGRDLLGDNIPPDELNLIEEGKNYGWPICYGQNIHDTNFDKNTYIRNPCMEPFEMPAKVDLQAHSAPLGLAFIPEEGWPEDYWYDVFVAYHGSWNRTEPTGYKVVRVKLDSRGNYEGTEDFITGWLTADKKVLGRPVDIMVQPGGTMYISDDKAGVIYKVTLTVTPR